MKIFNNKVIKNLMIYASLSLTVMIVLIITINHRVIQIPAEIKISEIKPGVTTVSEFERLIGTTDRSHTCMYSEIYRYIQSNSIWYGREVEIIGKYRGPNTGYPTANHKDVYDGDSVISKISVVVYPKLNVESSNLFEKYLAIFLNWEYNQFN